MAQGNVEVWLGTLLEMSRKSVHHVIRTAHTAVQDQGFNLLEFLSTFPAQVLFCRIVDLGLLRKKNCDAWTLHPDHF